MTGALPPAAEIAEKAILGFSRHPASRVWPDLTSEEYAELKKSIEAQGQIDPILVTADKQVIDGWHRLRAVSELGREPAVKVRSKITKGGVAMLICGLHCGRRHLGPKDRARLVIETYHACGVKFAEPGKRSAPSPTGAPNAITRQGVAGEAGTSTKTAQRAINEFKQDHGLAPPPDPTPDPFADDSPPANGSDPDPFALESPPQQDALDIPHFLQRESDRNPVTGERMPGTSSDTSPSPGYTPQPDAAPQKAAEGQPDPVLALEKELDEARATLEERNERIAVLEDGVSDEAKPLLDRLNNLTAENRTLKAQLNEKTSKLADCQRERNGLRRKITALEKQVAELGGTV